MKFRKKPVIIDAVQITEEWFNGVANMPIMMDRRIIVFPLDNQIEIQTLEGDMTAGVGDWIITGIRDELYPCKDDIFKMTYERV